jgi:hypothetical protein
MTDRQITPLMLMPMSEWKMKPVDDGIGQHVGIGIYAKPFPDGSYCRVWFKWPWSCLPNNVVGCLDLERCGVMGDFIEFLDRQDAAFAALG